jgi:ribose transport system permease protein
MARFHQPGEASFASRYALLVVWAIVVAIYGAIEPSVFFSQGTFDTIFGTQQALVFLGMAAVVVFAVGEFDLSISAVMGLAATLVPWLATVYHWNPYVASLFAIAACAVVGAANGLIIVRLGIDSIVTTLGMSTLILGITSGFSGSQAVSGLSSSFGEIANANIGFGLPVSFLYGVVLALVIAYVMRYTALGRHMAFVGANREVARLASVRVPRIRIGAYIVSGLLCGLGGVLVAASVGGFDPNSSPTYLLPALSATFLGTAVIKPGRFNPIGTLVAIYFLVTGIVGLQLLGYTGWIADVFYGGALILAVIVSTRTRRRTLAA